MEIHWAEIVFVWFCRLLKEKIGTASIRFLLFSHRRVLFLVNFSITRTARTMYGFLLERVDRVETIHDTEKFEITPCVYNSILFPYSSHSISFPFRLRRDKFYCVFLVSCRFFGRNHPFTHTSTISLSSNVHSFAWLVCVYRSICYLASTTRKKKVFRYPRFFFTFARITHLPLGGNFLICDVCVGSRSPSGFHSVRGN